MLVEAGEVHRGLEGSQIRLAEEAHKGFVVVEGCTDLGDLCFPRLPDSGLLNYYASSRS